MSLLEFLNFTVLEHFFISVHQSFQLCLTLYDSMDCSLPGFSVHEFSRQEYWSGLFFSQWIMRNYKIFE